LHGVLDGVVHQIRTAVATARHHAEGTAAAVSVATPSSQQPAEKTHHGLARLERFLLGAIAEGLLGTDGGRLHRREIATIHRPQVRRPDGRFTRGQAHRVALGRYGAMTLEAVQPFLLHLDAMRERARIAEPLPFPLALRAGVFAAQVFVRSAVGFVHAVPVLARRVVQALSGLVVALLPPAAAEVFRYALQFVEGLLG